MGKRKVAALEKVDADLAGLQYRIRKDPEAYESEFLENWNQYQASHDAFLANPSGADGNSIVSFRSQMDMIAHVAELYPQYTAGFADELKDLLNKHHPILETDLREKVVSSLVLLRRKDVIDSNYLLTTLFPILVSTPSKTFRTLLFQKILSDMRNSNSKHINHKLNRTIQTVLYNLITSDPTSPKGLWAVRLTRELWKRQIWTDSKPVDIMRQACCGDNEKVVVGAVRFFLGSDQEREEFEDDSSDDEAVDIRKVKHQIGINKKTKKKAKALDKAVDKVKRQERKKNSPHQLNFSALNLLHDPQGFTELIFEKHLQNSKAKMAQDSRLQILQLVTRLVGLHKLTLINLYSWFIKHLTPRQQSVTSYLASLAQATHSLVPPDVIEPLIQKIANEFVSEAAAADVASVGLNSIREICARQPLAMNDTLLQDLVDYRKSKDKGVTMAARGLLSLYRQNGGADMLKKKDRGKESTMGLRSGDLKQQKFGEEQAGEIEGLELLAKWKEEQRKRKRAEKGLPEDGDDVEKEGEDEEPEDDEWEVASEDSDSSGEWIRVSDSEDEAEPVNKKQKTDGADDEDDEDDKENAEEVAKDLAKLATTQILTPADLAKLKELRMEANIDKAMGNKKRKQEQEQRHFDEGLTAEHIEAPTKLRKLTKEERVALAKEGKPDREEHKSTQAIRQSKKQAEGKSSTNKEKARKKNFLMTLGKAKSKQKRSLVATRKALVNHVERSKAGGRRRNGVN